MDALLAPIEEAPHEIVRGGVTVLAENGRVGGLVRLADSHRRWRT